MPECGFRVKPLCKTLVDTPSHSYIFPQIPERSADILYLLTALCFFSNIGQLAYFFLSSFRVK
jgi:hypothetical protein